MGRCGVGGALRAAVASVADLHRRHDAQVLRPLDSAAPTSWPAMRSRSAPPGASRRRPARPRSTSASIPSMCCSPQKLRAAARPRGLVLFVVFFALITCGYALGRAAAVLDLGSRSQSLLRNPDAADHPAGPVDRGPRCPSSWWRSSCCSCAGCVGFVRRPARLFAADRHEVRRGGGRGRDPRPRRIARLGRRSTMTCWHLPPRSCSVLLGSCDRRSRPAWACSACRCSSDLFDAAAVAASMGELTWATTSNFLLVGDPVLRAVRRDPAALAAWPSACTTRWCYGCRGCPAG